MFLETDLKDPTSLLWFDMLLKAVDIFYDKYQYYPGAILVDSLTDDIQGLYECTQSLLQSLKLPTSLIPKALVKTMYVTMYCV